MRWYNSQCATSTTFQSVEHRRDVNGPFFHEFLLFTLTDGAICRLERVGEGSRSDAIRDVGCTAHDLIQWFDAEDYAELEAKHPSVPIAQIRFRRSFDILDVLAVCYSIQKTKACNIYTLQRYNCYFLCLTVLAMLSRQTANWEQVWEADITRKKWRLALYQMSNFVPDLYYSACGVLRLGRQSHHNDSDNLRGELLMDMLRQRDFSEESYSRIQKEIPLVLWIPQLDHRDYGYGVKDEMLMLLNFSARCWDAAYRTEIYNEQAFCFTQLAARVIYTTGADLVVSTIAFFLKCFIADIVGKTISTVLFYWRAVQTWLGWLFAAATSFAILFYIFLNRDHSHVHTELTELEFRDALGQGVPWFFVHFPGNAQHKLGLTYCSGRAVKLMQNFLESLSESEGGQMKFQVLDGSKFYYWHINPTVKFQQSYIKPRLRTHAKRVDAHRLGLYSSVYMDIHKAMTEVWRSMPPVEKHTPMEDQSGKCHTGQDARIDLRNFAKTIGI
ncbi:hypothetical protein FRC12_008085, partial [Ceratobasidium sp. 428]